ncbi:TRAP transporter substrate-binding protein [Alloyangia pacifica]|uniref:TRAP transporter substrate-binding protein n=1 Tax=Alloyangia pacifica TaxID=311180 RepID=UPI0031D799B7
MKIKGSLCAAALALGLAPAAFAETLKVSTFLPPNHAFNRMLTQWGEELAAKSNGELTVELFPSGQLGPAPRQFDLARTGAADVAVVLSGATPGRFPMAELAGLPLTYPALGNDSAITSRRLTELAPEYLAEEHAGTHILWMAVTPPLKLHLKSADPSDLSVFKGLRIRYAGAIWQQLIEALGASPVPVQPAETGDALAKGVVDGTAFPFEATKSFDLAPVLGYSIEPGFAAAAFAVVMGDKAYERLSPELRKLVDETTGPDRAEAFGKMLDEGEAEGRAYMAEGGVQIVNLSDAQLAQLKDDAAPIIAATVKAVDDAGKPGSEFLSAYTQ